MNAAPDLRAQIEAFPALQPSHISQRNSPIAGILLTNVDLDHVLGLFTLREGGPVHIYATPGMRAVLNRQMALGKVLRTFSGVRWHSVPVGRFAPLPPGDAGSRLNFRAIELSDQPPPFAKRISPKGIYSVAYQFVDSHTGKRLLVAPDVASVNGPLRQALEHSEAVIFDGTFWREDELAAIRPGAANAREMGHLPIQKGSLNLLANLRARHKIYIHINNTNPILAPDSAERRAVEAADIVVGEDGFSLQV